MRDNPTRVTIRKYLGDDAYSWAMFVNGRVTYTGLCRREAQWRRDVARANVAAGRRWNEARST